MGSIKSDADRRVLLTDFVGKRVGEIIQEILSNPENGMQEINVKSLTLQDKYGYLLDKGMLLTHRHTLDTYTLVSRKGSETEKPLRVTCLGYVVEDVPYPEIKDYYEDIVEYVCQKFGLPAWMFEFNPKPRYVEFIMPIQILTSRELIVMLGFLGFLWLMK